MLEDVVEDWKAIPGYDSYEASNTGKLRRLKDGVYVYYNPFITKKGYLRIPIINNAGIKLGRYLHVLVALAWLANPDNKPQVNHLDGVKTNNNLTNLEWSTSSENVIHSLETGLRNDNLTLSMLNVKTGELTEYRSLNELRLFLNIGIDTLVTYIHRSIKYPIFGIYTITATPEALERMLNTSKDQARTVYVYDHILETNAEYNSVAYASIITGMNTYSIREALGKKGLPYYYSGGYTYSYNVNLPYDGNITKEKAAVDREASWSKPLLKMYEGFEVYNYDTKDVTVYKDRNAVADALGCNNDAVSDAVIRGNRKNKTWLLRGYGIRAIGDNREWFDHGKAALLNSAANIKFDTPVFIVTYKDGTTGIYHGTLALSKVLNIDVDKIAMSLRGGQLRLDALMERFGLDVTLTKV